MKFNKEIESDSTPMKFPQNVVTFPRANCGYFLLPFKIALLTKTINSVIMSSFDPAQPPLIEETLLKKRRSLDELALRRSETLTNPNKRKRVIRGEDVKIKRPEQFIREARIKEGSLNKMNRRKSVVEAHTRGSIVPKSQIKKTVGVAVRIHGGRHSNELIKAELKALGLNKKYDAVFVKLDNDGIGM